MFNLIHQGTSPIIQGKNGLRASITRLGSARSLYFEKENQPIAIKNFNIFILKIIISNFLTYTI